MAPKTLYPKPGCLRLIGLTRAVDDLAVFRGLRFGGSQE